MKLNVIKTKESPKVLEGILMELETPAGYGQGIHVRRDKGEKYIIEFHRGTISDSKYQVRICDSSIITKSATEMIRETLMDKKIEFEEYHDVYFKNPNTENPNIKVSKRKPNLIYKA